MNIRHRILSTIIYADIFDYPLTFPEILHWLPEGMSEPRKNSYVLQQLIDMNSIEKRQGYFVLRGRSNLITLRKHREYASKKKMMLARAAAHMVSKIPTVECVGVTGGVSMNNADGEDDIDLCVIAVDHTVWMTRFLSTLLLDLKRVRRKPGDEHVKDKICLNMYWARHTNPVFSRDWYTAHEIIQMRTLFDRNQAYQQFLHHNEWVKQLFPEAWKSRFRKQKKILSGDSLARYFTLLFFRIIEPIAYAIQLIVMRPKRTTEIVTRQCIRFHPKDSRPSVLREFRKRLKKYNVPLDKQFIHS